MRRVKDGKVIQICTGVDSGPRMSAAVSWGQYVGCEVPVP